MYFSGAWQGYWEQAAFGRQFMHDLILRFDGGNITGEGHDCIGPFTFAGKYDDKGGIHLVKQYVGRHKVAYTGLHDGEGTIFGRWNIGDIWWGPFALRPDKSAVADLPILTIAACEPEA